MIYYWQNFAKGGKQNEARKMPGLQGSVRLLNWW